ncbi:phosphoribosylformylglycinamidine synthase subunit PurS [Staphylospora marina]|uniref:phosphoribosylformylglycinamidine synthase subunit PurS n=1 Tax=Staphylospora marina TaxID=2490858 RepID=UPI000F5B93CC|nr:phosphoribosylformylglycinamidine synthase subunit PurS [Staphylospora marina]
MFKATVYVTLKESVLDPQGKTVKDSLHALGYTRVRDARIGKRIELWLEGSDRSEAEQQVREMAEKLLANPVIENFTVELEEVQE